MLPARQPLKVFLVHFTFESPLLREFSMPLAADLVAFRVVILLSVGGLLFVICLALACGQRLGGGQHGSLCRSTVLVRRQCLCNSPIRAASSLARPKRLPAAAVSRYQPRATGSHADGTPVR